MHRDGNARGEEEERGAQKKHETARDRGHQIREGTRAAEHLSLSLSLSLSARSRAVSVARRDRDRGQGSERRIGPRSSSRGDAAAPPRHYSYVPVPQLRSLSIPWLLAARARGVGGRGVGGWVGGGTGKTGEQAAAAEFPLKTQTRPRMHARCNPMVCIRYARRVPAKRQEAPASRDQCSIALYSAFSPSFSLAVFPVAS